MKLCLTTLAVLALAPSANAFAGMSSKANVDVSRRESFANVAAIVGGIAGIVTMPNIAAAMPDEETAKITSRMGGLLVSSI